MEALSRRTTGKARTTDKMSSMPTIGEVFCCRSVKMTSITGVFKTGTCFSCLTIASRVNKVLRLNMVFSPYLSITLRG